MIDYKKLKIFFIFWLLSLFFVEGFLFKLQIEGVFQKNSFNNNKTSRGLIYDRWGRELVFNITRKSLAINTLNIPRKEKEKLARFLSTSLNISREKILEKLNYKSSFVWIKRILSPKEIEKLKTIISEDKIFLIDEPYRTYPLSLGTSPLLGFVGVDNQGLFGMEMILDPWLKDGKDVYLTIDKDLQILCANYLKEGVEKYKAEGGVIGILDINSGEVLTYTVIPDFDVKEESLSDLIVKFQDIYPLNMIFEPGSILKILTAIISLEEKITLPEIVCKGEEKANGHTVRCTEAHGKVNLEKAIVKSCNIYFYHLSEKIGPELWNKYLRRLYLDSTIPSDIVLLSKDFLIPNLKESKFTLGTVGFGQGIAFSPLKLLWSLSSIGNNGYLNELHFIKKIEDEKGKIIFENTPKKLDQVISEETSQKVLEYLSKVVKEGTANNLSIEGYKIGGKTGTAQIPKKNGYSNSFNHFFLGYLFLPEKRYAIIVMLREPKVGRYARETVVPIFEEVVKKLILYEVRR